MNTRWGTWGLVGVIALVSACASSDDKADTRQQALAFATNNIACDSAADCCAVLDGCMAQLLVVGAKDKTRVVELLASAPQDPCVGCIAPPVQVDCVGGVCMGAKLVPDGGSMDSYPSDFAQTHCGKMTPPTGWEESTTTQSSPGSMSPPLQVRTVIGCD